MKLILSSCDFRNKNSYKCITDNLGMPIQQCRVLYFPNEKATKEDLESEKFYNRLAEFGFARKNIYVFNYYSPGSFYDLDIDALYISGGNTFATLDRIRKAGFCDIIFQYVKNGAVYIGGSAGAHIACTNIKHILKYDSNPPNMSDFNGLKLFEGVLICHYIDEKKKDLLKIQRDGKYKVYSLTDDESLLIADNVVRKI
ncbi:MAG: Type 1 glutamine amidotransferase-like domain-containing protein [Clostridiaceae bacterium]|nr:Type 1 glutamine amidotransferase-like domain-containing protein [Clostridiaceae bacterium]